MSRSQGLGTPDSWTAVRLRLYAEGHLKTPAVETEVRWAAAAPCGPRAPASGRARGGPHLPAGPQGQVPGQNVLSHHSAKQSEVRPCRAPVPVSQRPANLPSCFRRLPRAGHDGRKPRPRFGVSKHWSSETVVCAALCRPPRLPSTLLEEETGPWRHSHLRLPTGPIQTRAASTGSRAQG